MRLVVLIVTVDFKREIIYFDVKHVRCINKGIPTWRCVKSGEENRFLPCVDLCLDLDFCEGSNIRVQLFPLS